MLYYFRYLVLLLSLSGIASSTPVKNAFKTKIKPDSICGDGQSEFIYYYFNVLGGLKINFINLFEQDVKFPKNTYSSESNKLVEGMSFSITQTTAGSLQKKLWNYYVNYELSDKLSDYYIVQEKDYLYLIQSYFKHKNGDEVTVDELVKLNSIADPDLIYTGALLKLPEDVRIACSGFNPKNRFAKVIKCC